MYQVTEAFRGQVIVTKKPPYTRDGGGRFDLDGCSQKDLQYLYDSLSLTDAVEYIPDPKHETLPDETQPKQTAKQPRSQRSHHNVSARK